MCLVGRRAAVWKWCYVSVLGLTGLSTAGVSAPWYLEHWKSDSTTRLHSLYFVCACVWSGWSNSIVKSSYCTLSKKRHKVSFSQNKALLDFSVFVSAFMWDSMCLLLKECLQCVLNVRSLPQKNENLFEGFTGPYLIFWEELWFVRQEVHGSENRQRSLAAGLRQHGLSSVKASSHWKAL